MAFTKKHSIERKEMVAIAYKMAKRGHTYFEIEKRLKKMYPDASVSRIKSACGSAMRKRNKDIASGWG